MKVSRYNPKVLIRKFLSVFFPCSDQMVVSELERNARDIEIKLEILSASPDRQNLSQTGLLNICHTICFLKDTLSEMESKPGFLEMTGQLLYIDARLRRCASLYELIIDRWFKQFGNQLN